MSHEKFLEIMKQMIDDLKAMSSALGLSNTGDEYKIISELFTYKFLNDKLLYDFKTREDKSETFDEFVKFADINTPKMKEGHLISNLYNQQNKENFHEIFDAALVEVSEINEDIYTIETASGQKKPLFKSLSKLINDEAKVHELSKRAVNILNDYQFDNIFNGGFDFFAGVFEYLIKDYNKDSGVYGEYFTPLFAGNIMADILYNDTPVSKVSVYDPAAGSGTLLLAMANKIGTDKCSIFSQDIAQKSTEFLRINLILNKLVHSLHNVIEGDTLAIPQHLKGNQIMQFDFIVSNPPFKRDFSSIIETLKFDKYDRFFAGLPKIPEKNKKGMAIYETFLQHIISSLSDKGKAAVVVPTGFVSASSGIPLKIRQHLVTKNWLRGVIHMPSNIFATTGTSVSIIFIDKTKRDEKVMLMDASNLGSKVSLEDGQRTILSKDEKDTIIRFFKGRIEEPEFSVLVDNEKITENGYSIQTGQYVQLKESKLNFNIDDRIEILKVEITESIDKNKQLDDEIKSILWG